MLIAVKVFADGERIMSRAIYGSEEEKDACLEVVNDLLPNPVDRLQRIREAGGWVSMETPPKQEGEYLVLLHEGSMINDFWISEGGGRFQFSSLGSHVTHYRPVLARPPQR